MMHRHRKVDRRSATRAGRLAALGAMLAACGSQAIANAPPGVVDQCRREVADLTDRHRLPPVSESVPEGPGPAETVIDDARAAKAETDGVSLATWPEEALLYRCLTSRGVVLTEGQASLLAEWQGRTDSNEAVD